MNSKRNLIIDRITLVKTFELNLPERGHSSSIPSTYNISILTYVFLDIVISLLLDKLSRKLIPISISVWVADPLIS